jgi:DNA replicative helicase MCM subunit Mcm2 (Cdc46/Mcm family)
MQIDTTTNNQTDTPAQHKERMKEAVAEYMSKRDQQKAIQTTVAKEGTRLEINIDDVRKHSSDLAQYIVKNPIEAVAMFESQIDRSVQDLSDEQKKNKSEK